MPLSPQEQAESFINGRVLLIDKPLHWTSFQAVNFIKHRAKRISKQKKIKVGHAGTLDPLATGLLIICIGKKTKSINDYMGLDKTYTGAFELGATTASYDKESEIDRQFSIEGISDEQIHQNCLQFLGEQQQLPPVFSAIKKEGKKMYEYARAGKEVEITPRTIFIKRFEISKIELPLVYFELECSKGTYVRSLAHDFGRTLNNGAHLASLRREAIGEFHVNEALSPQAWEVSIHKELV